TVGTGTGTGCGPIEKTMLTIVPSPTVVPPTGLCEITRPSATVPSYTLFAVPMFRPAALIVVTAPARVRATTFGTVATEGPSEMVMLTAEPGGAGVPAVGACASTRPAATAGSFAWVMVGARPTPAIWVVAADCVLPTTSGTRTDVGPLDTVITIDEPCATVAPPLGSWLMIVPACTDGLVK